MSLQDLYDKRTNLYEQMKQFLNERKDVDSGVLSATDAETYAKMENDYTAFTDQIEREKRLQTIDKVLGEPVNAPALPNPEHSVNAKVAPQVTATKEYARTFWDAVRLRPLSREARNVLTGGGGEGYLAPTEFSDKLVEALTGYNVIRGLANVMKVSGNYRIPVGTGEVSVAFGEVSALRSSGDLGFRQVALNAHKMSGLTKVSENLIADEAFDVEKYVIDSFARGFAKIEEQAFLYGGHEQVFNDVAEGAMPRGIFYTTRDGNHDYDPGYKRTAWGKKGDSKTELTFENVLDVYHGLKNQYRKNASWVISDVTARAIRSITDGDGRFLWQPSLTAGTPDTLLGAPVYISSAFYNSLGAWGNVPMACFGDFSYFTIADRQERTLQVLDERFADEGLVGYRVTQRLDCAVTLPEAFSILVRNITP